MEPKFFLKSKLMHMFNIDEPANIALSDYSSLSSGDDFSSCDEDNR